MYKLYKHSKPTWVKSFDNVDDLTEELWQHMCGLCAKLYGNDVSSMLSSDCGCEYEIEGLTPDYPVTDSEHIQLNYEKKGLPA